MQTDMMKNNIKNFPIQLGNFQVNFLSNVLPFQIKNLWTKHAHFHGYYELFYIIEGEVSVNIGSEIIYLKKNDTIIIPPEVCHHIIDSTQDIRCICFSIDFSHAKRYGKFAQNKEAEFYYPVFASLKRPIVVNPSIEEYAESLERLSGIYDFESVTLKNKTELILSLIFVEISRAVSLAAASNGVNGFCDMPDLSDDEILLKYRIELFIHRNFDKNIKAEDLSSELFISGRQLHRIIKKFTGSNFSNLLLKQRMIYAKMLIEFTELELNEIAVSVGYQSYKGFFDAFKKYYNVSPQKFARK